MSKRELYTGHILWGTDVSVQISSQHKEHAEENMSCLRSVISGVVFCDRQSLALPGYWHKAFHAMQQSDNHGSFSALMRFRADAGDKLAM